jgi:hypothetical protein
LIDIEFDRVRNVGRPIVIEIGLDGIGEGDVLRRSRDVDTFSQFLDSLNDVDFTVAGYVIARDRCRAHRVNDAIAIQVEIFGLGRRDRVRLRLQHREVPETMQRRRT